MKGAFPRGGGRPARKPPPRRGRLRRFAARAVVCGGLCAACDESMVAPAAPVACAQIGQQCQLPGGPLGVCEPVKCAAGATPPCFTCQSQH